MTFEPKLISVAIYDEDDIQLFYEKMYSDPFQAGQILSVSIRDLQPKDFKIDIHGKLTDLPQHIKENMLEANKKLQERYGLKKVELLEPYRSLSVVDGDLIVEYRCKVV